MDQNGDRVWFWSASRCLRYRQLIRARGPLYCVFAIWKAREVIEYSSLKTIAIYIDSKSAILTLTAPASRSRLMRKCKEVLNRLGEQRNIELVWVPGHNNIQGTEITTIANSTKLKESTLP